MPDFPVYLWVLALNFKYVCLIHNTQRTQRNSEGPQPGAFKREELEGTGEKCLQGIIKQKGLKWGWGAKGSVKEGTWVGINNTKDLSKKVYGNLLLQTFLFIERVKMELPDHMETTPSRHQKLTTSKPSAKNGFLLLELLAHEAPQNPKYHSLLSQLLVTLQNLKIKWILFSIATFS